MRFHSLACLASVALAVALEEDLLNGESEAALFFHDVGVQGSHYREASGQQTSRRSLNTAVNPNVDTVGPVPDDYLESCTDYSVNALSEYGGQVNIINNGLSTAYANSFINQNQAFVEWTIDHDVAEPVAVFARCAVSPAHSGSNLPPPPHPTSHYPP